MKPFVTRLAAPVTGHGRSPGSRRILLMKETAMEARTWGKRMLDRNGILYPMLVIAAVSVIIFSMLGIAMMMGLLPRAESMTIPHEITQSKSAASGNKGCNNCVGEITDGVE